VITIRAFNKLRLSIQKPEKFESRDWLTGRERISSEAQVTLMSALKATEAIREHLERFYEYAGNCVLQPKESE
jgi:hypothetical protein